MARVATMPACAPAGLGDVSPVPLAHAIRATCAAPAASGAPDQPPSGPSIAAILAAAAALVRPRTCTGWSTQIVACRSQLGGATASQPAGTATPAASVTNAIAIRYWPPPIAVAPATKPALACPRTVSSAMVGARGLA